MSVVSSAIRFPVTVVVGAIIAIAGGFLAFTAVPVQLTPEVERPIVTVTTNWIGASPEEIEKEIIEEQEDYLKSVEGLLKMTSTSNDGQGVVTLEFPAGTDITSTVVRVTNKLNEVPSYPDNADRPIISTSDQLDGAIAWFIIKARDTSQIFVPNVQDLVEDFIQPRLERVEGVSSINIFGGLEQELHVVFSTDRLASAGITVTDLANALRSQNTDVSAGDIGEGKRRYVVRTVNRFNSIDDVEQTVIRVIDGVPIRVLDVADVELTYQKPRALVRHLGEPAIAFNAQREVGANVIAVLDGLEEQLAILDREILQPRGLYSQVAYKETVYINSAIDLVIQNIWVGGLLAIFALFIFLRSWSAIGVIAVAIPISIITTFLMMSIFGRSINVISLAGMAFAVGMVVDAAIVVLENIYRHMQMGKPRFKAATDATLEVWGALLASAVTTVAVFLPILFIAEQAGQLFKDIAIAISSAIVISLIVSVTVIPTMASRILSTSARVTSSEGKPGGFLGIFSRTVASFVDWINRSLVRRVVAVLGIVSFSLGLSWLLLPNAEYLPTGNQNLVFAGMLPPPGYNIDEMISLGEQIEDQIRPLWETDPAEADTLAGGGVDNFFFVAVGGFGFMGLRARDELRARELVPVANRAIGSIPGTYGFASQTSIFGRGVEGTRSVQIDVSGPDLNQILALATPIFFQISEVVPGAGAQPDPGLDLGSPEVRVYPDPVRATQLGLSASEIGLSVNALVDGAIVSEFYQNGREIDLLIRGSDDRAQHTQDVAMLPLSTSDGRLISIADVADVRQTQGPVQINHVERQRTVSLIVSLPDEVPLELAVASLDEQIIQPMRDQGQIGGLYDVTLSGTADDLTKLRAVLANNLILAVLLTYLLLAALFQSFIYPLVIMVTVPLATFGGVLGLNVIRLFNPTQQLDVLTMLGFVILIGTVINNAILIVYQALNYMREGKEMREAVKEAVQVRVRPIMMSTGTSTLGMLPLIVMPGAGSELYRGLGSVVVGGLALSTIVTLVLTPLVFSFILDAVSKIRSLLGLSGQVVSAAPSIEQQ